MKRQETPVDWGVGQSRPETWGSGVSLNREPIGLFENSICQFFLIVQAMPHNVRHGNPMGGFIYAAFPGQLP